MMGALHTDCKTKLKFYRTHDHVDRKDDPPHPAMTRLPVRQGGNAWNLFDFDNQSAAIFVQDTIKYD